LDFLAIGTCSSIVILSLRRRLYLPQVIVPCVGGYIRRWWLFPASAVTSGAGGWSLRWRLILSVRCLATLNAT